MGAVWTVCPIFKLRASHWFVPVKIFEYSKETNIVFFCNSKMFTLDLLAIAYCINRVSIMFSILTLSLAYYNCSISMCTKSWRFWTTSDKQKFVCACVSLIVCLCEWVSLILDAQHVAPAFLVSHLSPLLSQWSLSLQCCLCHDSSLSRESQAAEKATVGLVLWPEPISALKRNTTRSEHNCTVGGHYYYYLP